MNITSIKDSINKNTIGLLYLSTKACNVCKVLKPKIQNIISKYDGIEEIYIELDDLPELKGEFSVFSVPTIILFIEGKESLRYGRSIDLYEFEEKLSRFIKLMK